MNSNVKKIAIVGGGITGLSAAFYTRQLCKERGITAEITLIEQSKRYGGKVKTLQRDGCVIEQGPDSFLARKLPMLELARELGLENELTAVNPRARSFIIHKNELHRMPQGLILGIPTEIMPFVKTGLISPLGKVRAALDLMLPKRATTEDESLGHFLRRRLGTEVLERIAEPLLAGIYAGDTDMLSLQATFPQFGQMEQQHRSIMLGMLRSRKKQQTPSGASSLPPVAKGAMFLTFKKGLSTLIDALTIRLRDIEWISGQPVTAVTHTEDGIQVRMGDEDAKQFDAVIVAAPNYEAAAMIKPLAAERALIDIPYASVANVAFAYRRSEVIAAMNGSGFVVPRGEGLTITACTWTSVKWLHTSPDDIALVRCYVGRQGDDRGVVLSDEEMIAKVREDLHRTMGITAKPLFVESARWGRSMPQYTVGHLERLAQYREKLQEALPGVFLAGSGYQGVGLPDCIAQGKQAAVEVLGLFSWR